jgi:hypothetical protein
MALAMFVCLCVRLSVRLIQLKNRWTYSIVKYSKVVLAPWGAPISDGETFVGLTPFGTQPPGWGGAPSGLS